MKSGKCGANGIFTFHGIGAACTSEWLTVQGSGHNKVPEWKGAQPREALGMCHHSILRGSPGTHNDCFRSKR